MKKGIRIIFWVTGMLVSLGLLLFGIGYFLNSGDFSVPKTIDQDKSLSRIEIGDLSLHGETFGQDTNQVVIVLHGGPGNDYRMLLPLVPLSDKYFLVFYDQRGSGLSPRIGKEEITIDSFYEDLRVIIEHFSPKRKVHIIGHSWGAMLASGFIGKYPDRVEKVVLAEPGFLNSEFGNELMDKTNFFMPEINMDVLFKMANAWFKSMHVTGPDDQARMDFFFEEIAVHTEIDNHPMAGYFCNGDMKAKKLELWRVGALVSQTMNHLAINNEGRIEISFIEGIEKFQNKVLFLSGECNTLIGPEFQRQQMKLFNQAELVVIPESGHNMISEQPEVSMKAVTTYFEE